MAHRPLRGSERAPLAGYRSVGNADPQQRLEVSVLLKRQSGALLDAHVARLGRGGQGEAGEQGKQDGGATLTRAEFAQQFGAHPDQLAAVRKFAADYRLTVTDEHAARRTVRLSGTVAQFNAAFGVDLQRFEAPGGSYRGRVGALQLPEELLGVVDAVLGLDDRAQAKPHFRRRPQAPSATRGAAAGPTSTSPTSTSPSLHVADAPAGTFTPPQVAAAYNFPAAGGQGQTIALIELGGGYNPDDIAGYFGELGIAPPTVLAVSVDGAANQPSGDPDGADGEVELDIEVAGAIAPGARIAVYFAPNTDAGFIDAVTTAVHDTTNQPSVISISWGGPESQWTQQSLTALDQAFQDAATLGITVCVASGDNGSSDGLSDGANHVDFPASSAYALACGGTSLQASGSTIAAETVWNDGAQGGASGGGVSAVFALPAWQQGLQVTDGSGNATPLAARGVPDVCGNADPQTGYLVRVDGSDTVIGGTSAVAPLWAGLIACINATRGSSVGLIHPQIYKAASALQDITQGNNGAFSASVGWDACTGLGSPNGAAIGALLTASTGR